MQGIFSCSSPYCSPRWWGVTVLLCVGLAVHNLVAHVAVALSYLLAVRGIKQPVCVASQSSGLQHLIAVLSM